MAAWGTPPPSVPLTDQSLYLGPRDNPAHLAVSELWLPLEYAWLDYVLVFGGPGGIQTPCLSSPLPTSYPPGSLACPRGLGKTWVPGEENASQSTGGKTGKGLG